MRVRISLDAEQDLADGFWFYESKQTGLGSSFRESLRAEIRSLKIVGGTHSLRHGYHRKVCKTFPFSIFYKMDSDSSLTVMAVFSQKRGEKWIAKTAEKQMRMSSKNTTVVASIHNWER